MFTNPKIFLVDTELSDRFSPRFGSSFFQAVLRHLICLPWQVSFGKLHPKFPSIIVIVLRLFFCVGLIGFRNFNSLQKIDELLK